MTIYFCDGEAEKCDFMIFCFCLCRHLLGDQPGDRIDWKKTIRPIWEKLQKFWSDQNKKDRQDR